MATNFKYASQTDLQNYFNRFGDFERVVNYKPFGLYEFSGYNKNPIKLLKSYMNKTGSKKWN